MYFYEEVSTIRYFFHKLLRKPARYYRRSLFLIVLFKLFPKLSKDIGYVKAMNFGDIKSYKNILKNAYLNGERYVNQINSLSFLKTNSNLFNIDFPSVFKQFLFSEVVCPKYEFFELAIRYAYENPKESYIFYLKKPLSSTYKEIIRKVGKIHICRNYNKVTFLFPIIFLPLFLRSYWKARGQNKVSSFDNKVICNSPKVPTKEMFRDIFADYSEPIYVMSYPYLDRYSMEELKEFGIVPVKLSREDYIFLKKHLWAYVFMCLRFYKELSVYGLGMFRLFFCIVRGKEMAPSGKDNVFVTSGHFNVTWAIRNEFIRLEGSKSVFVPKNIYVYSKYYYKETYHNYDVICSSGKQLEDNLKLSGNNVKLVLPVGSYDVHKMNRDRDEDLLNRQRLGQLSLFTNNSDFVITVLSCGLVDKSYRIETKLMNLAERLSQQRGVKVIVRMKHKRMESASLMSKPAGFYHDFTKNNPSMLLTGTEEYELLDFLPITDLFVTSISNSGFDVIMRDGVTIFVDFLNASDLLLPWDVVKEAVVPEENALMKILRYINEAETLNRYRDRIKDLKEYLGYTFPDFKAYKENLINQLRDNISFFPKGKESVRTLS